MNEIEKQEETMMKEEEKKKFFALQQRIITDLKEILEEGLEEETKTAVEIQIIFPLATKLMENIKNSVLTEIKFLVGNKEKDKSIGMEMLERQIRKEIKDLNLTLAYDITTQKKKIQDISLKVYEWLDDIEDFLDYCSNEVNKIIDAFLS